MGVGARILAVLLTLGVSVTFLVWLVYFWYRIAVTVNAWPFG